MSLRTLKNIYRAQRADMGELITYRAMPTAAIDHLDPFLFINHHGPQQFPPNNSGLPFGPHPHRGFETLTFVLQGSLVHSDSTGITSNIKTGGIQWMTAGSGIVHSELASEEFKREGGMEEIIQLWLNLPAKLKNTSPKYVGLQADEIPQQQEKGIRIKAISGEWNGLSGPIASLSEISMAQVDIESGSKVEFAIPEGHQILFYVVKGAVEVNGAKVAGMHLAEFDLGTGGLAIEAEENSTLLLGHASPTNEPIVAYGPFVMNTEEEIRQAYSDYQNGKFV